MRRHCCRSCCQYCAQRCSLTPPELAEVMALADVDKDGMKLNSAFIIGHTGAVGKELVRILVTKDLFARVILIGRREVDLGADPLYKNVEQKVVDFDKIEDYQDAFRGASVGFCALGTTRAKAGKEGFYKVDHDYIVSSAKVAREAGCDHFSLVSSNHADVNSWFYYLKVKGEAERDVEALGFPRLTISRPGFLESADRGQEARFGEKVATLAFKPVKWFRPTAWSVTTESVAKAAILDAFLQKNDPNRRHLLTNDDIHRFSAKFDETFGSS